MSRNVFAVPRELYEADLPPGYDCTLYVGRMVGQLGPMTDNPTTEQFSFEITDIDDPTHWLLKFTTYDAPASELARWENVGDTVGIVIASKNQQLEIVMAFNFTRRKWFATGFYPHVKARSLADRMSVSDVKTFTTLSIFGIFLCGIGIIALPIMIAVSAAKSQQYRVLNPTNYRGVTAQRIAEWIAKNRLALGSSGNPALDPSL